jgi:hypothetical protein
VVNSFVISYELHFRILGLVLRLPIHSVDLSLEMDVDDEQFMILLRRA